MHTVGVLSVVSRSNPLRAAKIQFSPAVWPSGATYRRLPMHVLFPYLTSSLYSTHTTALWASPGTVLSLAILFLLSISRITRIFRASLSRACLISSLYYIGRLHLAPASVLTNV